jgi:hypothetical protein
MILGFVAMSILALPSPIAAQHKARAPFEGQYSGKYTLKSSGKEVFEP